MPRTLILALALLTFAAAALALPAAAAPASAPQLLAVGDSLTAGLYATALDGGFAPRVAEALGAELTAIRSGTVPEMLVRLPAYAPAAADIVLVELGLNDSAKSEDDVVFAVGYGQLLDELRRRYPEARIIATTMFPAPTGLTERRGRYNAAIRREATARGLEVADVAVALAGCAPGCTADPKVASPFAPHYAGDGWHPGDDGHQAIADAILGVLEPAPPTLYLPLLSR